MARKILIIDSSSMIAMRLKVLLELIGCQPMLYRQLLRKRLLNHFFIEIFRENPLFDAKRRRWDESEQLALLLNVFSNCISSRISNRPNCLFNPELLFKPFKSRPQTLHCRLFNSPNVTRNADIGRERQQYVYMIFVHLHLGSVL